MKNIRQYPPRLVNLFLDNIQIDILTGCWNWVGPGASGGYGSMFVNGEYFGTSYIRSHRFSYLLHVGEIPDGMVIDHLCRNTMCSNPNHLECVTHLENVFRGVAVPVLNSKKTHCHKGHPFSGDNLHIYVWRGRVMRRCKQCQKDKDDLRRINGRNRSRTVSAKEQGSSEAHTEGVL